MGPLETATIALGRMDSLAGKDTWLHRLEPRAKLLTTFAFLVAVLSFDKYAVTRMLPFALYPVAIVTLAGLPWGWLFKRLLIAAPFVLFVAIFNPFIDREILLELGPLRISGGWVSLTSILIRFILAVCAVLTLIATTGIDAVCAALVRLRAPRAFVVQILLLYRYLFVLIAEVGRMRRAHGLRAFKGTRMQWRTYGSLVGRLLLRTLDRGQAIHRAMKSRGFNGEIRWARRRRLAVHDVLFFLGWCAFFISARMVNLPERIGRIVLELVG